MSYTMKLWDKDDLYMIFIDLEKAYDEVLKDVLCWVATSKEVCRKFIDIIKDMYEGRGS